VITNSANRAVEELFTEWYRPLLRYAVRLAGTLPLAEDFVQEAFISYYRAVAADRHVECPKAYTVAAVRHQAQRAWAAQREGQIPVSIDDLNIPVVAPEADEVALIWDDLQRLLANLSPREAEVILLRSESLTYGEIASQLGIAVTSVGTHLARAISKLQMATRPPQKSQPIEADQAKSSQAKKGDRG
jgi:RNA polymerase sigma factor (sigma-70 family)